MKYNHQRSNIEIQSINDRPCAVCWSVSAEEGALLAGTRHGDTQGLCAYSQLAGFFDDVVVYWLRGSVYHDDVLIIGYEHKKKVKNK